LVVVVAVLVELETPDVSPGVPLAVAPVVDPVPEAPIELVLPGVPVLPLVLAVPPMLAEPLVPLPLVPAVLELPVVAPPDVEGVVVALRSVVLDVLDDVVGAPVSSRLVQAPRETAATSARAAHEVRDAFIRELLEGMLCGRSKGRLAPPYWHSRHPRRQACRPQPQIFVGQTQAPAQRSPRSAGVLLVCFIALPAAVPRSSLPLSGVPASSGCMSVLGVFSPVMFASAAPPSSRAAGCDLPSRFMAISL
jgi:hypothetical protein